MKKISGSKKVYVMQSRIAGAGRGVYVAEDIASGELIERCPVIELEEENGVNESFLVTYLFYCGKEKNRALIALGFGSIYNHSYEPNARYEIKQEEAAINFVALRNIKRDEEILINYKGDSKNKDPLWFED